MFHHHGKGAVDKVLIGNDSAYGGGAVKAVFGGIPVKVCDGVESAIGLDPANNAVSCGLFKADLR